MNGMDILLLLAIALCVTLAVRYIKRSKGACGSCNGCNGCNGCTGAGKGECANCFSGCSEVKDVK